MDTDMSTGTGTDLDTDMGTDMEGATPTARRARRSTGRP